MANLPISGLPNGSALTGAELLVAVQGGNTVQTTAEAVLNYVTSSISSQTIDTGSFATTGSNTFEGNQQVNGYLETTDYISTDNVLYTNAIEENLTNGGITFIAGGSGFAFSNNVEVTGSVNATNFTGSLLGTASISNQLFVTQSIANTNFKLLFATTGDGYKNVLQDSGVDCTYNPWTNTLTATNLEGTATNATNVNIATNSTNTNYYVTFGFGSGNNRVTIDGGGQFTYNPSTNILTVPTVVANLTGTATTASYVGTAQTASYVLNAISSSFAISASYAPGTSQTLQQVLDTDNTATSSIDIDGDIFATNFSGDNFYGQLTGNVNGNASTATSAQTATTASYAATASSADNFNVRTSLTASGLIYPSTDGTLNQAIVTDGTGNLTFANVIASTANNTVTTGKNVSGAPILKGTPLYFTGSGTSGNLVGILPADAGNPARMPAGGIAGEAIADEAEGVVFINGYIGGVDTSAFTSGDQVYVAVGGGYTNIVPTGSALVQKLGNVEKVDNTAGSGVINGPGAVRSVPNINPGYTWVGNSDWVATPVSTASLFVTSASYADQALSASFAITASYVPSGLPAGGTTGQILVKSSGTDYDTSWSDPANLPFVAYAKDADQDIATAQIVTFPSTPILSAGDSFGSMASTGIYTFTQTGNYLVTINFNTSEYQTTNYADLDIWGRLNASNDPRYTQLATNAVKKGSVTEVIPITASNTTFDWWSNNSCTVYGTGGTKTRISIVKLN